MTTPELKEELDNHIRLVNACYEQLLESGKYTNVRDFRKALQAIKIIAQQLRQAATREYKERIA